MTNKSYSVNVIGGGLLGCLTALKIREKNKSININLIDSGNHLLSSYDSISLNKQRFNNGFHGIEFPRASELISFLEKISNNKFLYKPNNRLLSINNSLVEFNKPLLEWPDELQILFKKKKGIRSNKFDDFWEILSVKYKDLLAKVSKRYSSQVSNCEHLLIPWFMPSDFIYDDDDEGIIFQNKVRNQSIKPQYVFPPSGLFEDLQEHIGNFLEKKNININLDTNFYFDNNNNIKFSKSEGEEISYLNSSDINVMCASSISLLKNLENDKFRLMVKEGRVLINILLETNKIPEHLDNITEVLCLNEEIKEISRISFPSFMSTKNNSSNIQVELFADEDFDLETLKKNCAKQVGKILNFSQKQQIKYLDSKVSRKVFFPDKELLSQCYKIINKFTLGINSTTFLNKPYFGPINMSKAWMWSTELCEEVTRIKNGSR